MSVGLLAPLGLLLQGKRVIRCIGDKTRVTGRFSGAVGFTLKFFLRGIYLD
jgi:hypothetical protein